MRAIGTMTLVGMICICVWIISLGTSLGAVTAEEAAKLKTTLTPFGAERAGNKEGTIPAWTGGNTTPIPGFVNGGPRLDAFPDEKPLFSVTAKNMDQYAGKLTEGVKDLLKRYPDTFRLDIYPTHRTHAAPQWIYDNTFKNATRAKLDGYTLENAYGGTPFPIPKSGIEVMWNHVTRWRGVSYHKKFRGYLGTADGKHVWLLESVNDEQTPYYQPDGSLETFDGTFWEVLTVNTGPPIRAGEGIVGIKKLDPSKDKSWTYLTGQRRVRRLPISCCDAPTPFSAGISSFDEVDVFLDAESMVPFDWKIIGKQEMFIPYNSNKTFAPTREEVLGEHHLNPDYVRWELHRVWVVEANLREGQRHTSPKNRYYVDEDTWIAALADRWDANGQLWRMLFTIIATAPDIPATINTTWGFYDLLGGTFFVNVLMNEYDMQYQIMPYYPQSLFTPESLTSGSVR